MAEKINTAQIGEKMEEKGIGAKIYEKMADDVNMSQIKNNLEEILDKIEKTAKSGKYFCELSKEECDTLISEDILNILKRSGFVISSFSGKLCIVFGAKKSYKDVTIYEVLNYNE